MFAIIIGLIIFENSLFFIGTSSIGKFLEVSKQVTLRDAENIAWREALPYSSIHPGDEVAVATQSSAVIEFTKNRLVEFGEETVASVKAVSFQNDFHIIVNLSSGTVKAKILKESPYKLTINAGAESYLVDAKKSAVIEKKAGEKSKTIPVQNWRKDNFKVPIAVVSSNSPLPVTVPAMAALPILTPQPSPEPTAAPLVAQNCVIADLKTTTEFFTDLSFEQIADQTIEFQKPNATGCNLSVFYANGHELKIREPSSKRYALTIKDLKKPFQTKILSNGLESLKFYIASEKTAKQKYFFEIISSQRLFNSTQAIAINITKLPAQKMEKPLVRSTVRASPNDLNLRIVATSARELKNLAPLFKAADGIFFSSVKSYNDSGYFVGKKAQVIAQLKDLKSQKLTDDLQIQRILNLLDADILFFGKFQSLVSLQKLNELTASAKNPPLVFVDYKSRLFPVQRKFFQNPNQLTQFLQKFVGSVFTDTINIIARRKSI